jgi:Uma2 family endonuclease
MNSIALWNATQSLGDLAAPVGVGDRAPDFALPVHTGGWLGLWDMIGPAVDLPLNNSTHLLAMPAEPAYVRNMGVTLMTADELLLTSIPDKLVELVRGRLVVREPPGYVHGDVAMRLGTLLAAYAHERGLGRVLAAETGFKLQSDPDTVRAADVAFIRLERVPDPRPVGYPALAPDLAVEVLSPRDRPGETLNKVGDWLDAGTRLVWVIDPERRLARVYRLDGTESQLSGDAALDGEDVLPGFTCPLASIL